MKITCLKGSIFAAGPTSALVPPAMATAGRYHPRHGRAAADRHLSFRQTPLEETARNIADLICRRAIRPVQPTDRRAFIQQVSALRVQRWRWRQSTPASCLAALRLSETGA